MNSNKELNWDELNHSYQPSDFNFLTTNDVRASSDLLGQEDMIKVFEQRLRIADSAYNMYVCSDNNRKIQKRLKQIVYKVAAEQKPVLAMGYIYNFHQPEQPILLTLPYKEALHLKDDLEELKAFIVSDLPRRLESTEVKAAQEEIVDTYDTIKTQRLLELEQLAKSKNILTKVTLEGIQFTPLDAFGKPMQKEAFEALTEEEEFDLKTKIMELQQKADEVIDQINQEEEYYYQLYEEVKQEVVLREIGGLVKKLKEKYEAYEGCTTYFNDLASDILKHLEILAVSEKEAKEAKRELIPWLNTNDIEKYVQRYGFNLLNAPPEKGVPVIEDFEVGEMPLAGKILISTEGNNLYSDYSYIRPGLFHLSNGGYLILHVETLIEHPGAWQSIKYLLRTGKIKVEGSEELGVSLALPVRPQEAPARLKIILIGSEEIYDVLSQYDQTFNAYFKAKINCYSDIKYDKTNIEKLARCIKQMTKEEKLLPVTTDGLLKMVAYECRKQGDVRRLSTNLESFKHLLREAQLYAKACIDSTCIQKAIEVRERHDRLLQEQIDESIMDDICLLDIEGRRIGQINGLAIYQLGELSLGRPVKITVTTYRGKSGIVDIENAAKLSGAIHTKGVHIITGFLGHQFAQDFPLSLNCNICFEQSYGMIDGDSASSAELYAILSSLAEAPIEQGLAVTGSVNQFGEIQPIGGVNEKIEGFFKVCKLKGLTGHKGVLIPRQNVKELFLNQEVITAVQNKQFHIYSITSIWEGIEVLTHMSAAEVKMRVYDKLKKYSE